MPARLLRFLLALVLGMSVLGASVSLAAPASAAATGTLSGTLTGDGGTLSSAQVTLTRLDEESGEFYYVASVYIASDTEWSFADLEAGTYHVRFEPETTFASEFWNNQRFAEDADAIVLTEGQTRDDIDADLALSGTLTGAVTAASGDPIGDYQVVVKAWAHTPGGDWQEAGSTSVVGGEYELTGLQPGTTRSSSMGPTPA